MPKSLQSLKREQLFGLTFVLMLHGMALYGLWSYRIIPTPVEALIMVSNLIDPPARPAKPPQPKPPKPPLPEPPPPEHLHLVAEAPVVLPDEPVAYAPPPPEPVIEASPQPVVLASELSVSCQEREPPSYPLQSMRLNEQGRVMLRVEMGEDGRVHSAEVKSSSGFRRLDEAAVVAVKSWRCNPAVRNGVAVPAVALQPFVFILEGR
ncbi:MAG: energy transducer TonB [Gallionella sp.]